MRGRKRAPMDRYFFHVHDDFDVVDEEGLVLPNEEAARQTAVSAARSLICEQVTTGRLTLHHRIEVCDDRGDHLFDVPFGEAVEIQD